MSDTHCNKLPGPDQAAITEFWHRYVAACGDDAQVFTDADCFGDSVELANELIALIVDGPKRATAGSVAEYRHHNVAIPMVGDLFVATDGFGKPRAVLRTTDVRVGPLSSVDDQFAWDEGEGDRTRRYWLQAHTACFKRAYETMELDFHEHIDVVFERFDVLYTER